MKLSSSNEIRNLGPDEIAEAVAELRQSIRELRFTAKISQLSNVKEISAKKRQIARLLTIAQEEVKAQ